PGPPRPRRAPRPPSPGPWHLLPVRKMGAPIVVHPRAPGDRDTERGPTVSSGMERIGVMGAGVMGAGIAQVLAVAGHEVVCYDISEEALSKGRAGVETGRFGVRGSVERGKLSAEEADAALARLTFTGDLDHVAATNLIVEAVPELIDLKITVFHDLDRRAPE